jgi:hypothetical protein
MLMTNIFETIVIVTITDAHYIKILVLEFFHFFLQMSGTVGKKLPKAKILI